MHWRHWHIAEGGHRITASPLHGRGEIRQATCFEARARFIGCRPRVSLRDLGVMNPQQQPTKAIDFKLGVAQREAAFHRVAFGGGLQSTAAPGTSAGVWLKSCTVRRMAFDR